MKILQVKIPDRLEINEDDISMLIAAKLYEDAKISAGEAAEIAGLSKRAFIELLGRYGVSVFSSSVSDLYEDISNA